MPEKPVPADPGLRCFGRDDGTAREQYAFKVMRWPGAKRHEFEVHVRLRVHRLEQRSDFPWTINTLLDNVWGPGREIADRVEIRSARGLPLACESVAGQVLRIGGTYLGRIRACLPAWLGLADAGLPHEQTRVGTRLLSLAFSKPNPALLLREVTAAREVAPTPVQALALERLLAAIDAQDPNSWPRTKLPPLRPEV